MVALHYINGVAVFDDAGHALQEQEAMRKRVPPSLHQELTDRGIKWDMRLEIPLRAVGGYDDMAELLRGLADRLQGIRRAQGEDHLGAVLHCSSEILATNRRLAALRDKHYGDARAKLSVAKGRDLARLYTSDGNLDGQENDKGTKVSRSGRS